MNRWTDQKKPVDWLIKMEERLLKKEISIVEIADLIPKIAAGSAIPNLDETKDIERVLREVCEFCIKTFKEGANSHEKKISRVGLNGGILGPSSLSCTDEEWKYPAK